MEGDEPREDLKDLARLDPEDVKSLLSEAAEKLARQPSLVSLSAEKVIVVGDTHGDAHTSLSVINNYLMDNATLLFLGDYVDRGPHQLENLLLLTRKFLETPGRVILLRGNHETPEMNRWYGFLDVVSRKYGPQFYGHFASLFSQLSISAVVNERFLALHGGIARSLRSIEQLSDLPKGVLDPRGTLAEVLWNDPDESIQDFAPSVRGPGIFRYGRRAVSEFLRFNRLETLIRSHEPRPNGVSVEMYGMVYVVFSCRHYGVTPGALLIEKNELIPLSLS